MADEQKTKAPAPAAKESKPAQDAGQKGSEKSTQKSDSSSKRESPAKNELMASLFNAFPLAAGGGLLGALGGFLFTDGPANESSSERMRRRIRNAIRLGAMGTGIGGSASLIKDMFNDDSTKPEDEYKDIASKLAKGFHKKVNIFDKSDPSGTASGALYGGVLGGGQGIFSGIKSALRNRAEGLKAVQAALGNSITTNNIRDALSKGNVRSLFSSSPIRVGTDEYNRLVSSARAAAGKGSGSKLVKAFQHGATKGTIGSLLGSLAMLGIGELSGANNDPVRR